jgi:hypothetical protein
MQYLPQGVQCCSIKIQFIILALKFNNSLKLIHLSFHVHSKLFSIFLTTEYIHFATLTKFSLTLLLRSNSLARQSWILLQTGLVVSAISSMYFFQVRSNYCGVIMSKLWSIRHLVVKSNSYITLQTNKHILSQTNWLTELKLL